MSYCCAYTCGACKIFCYMCCCKCFQKEAAVKEEFSLLILGLRGAGKSSLLSKLCCENDVEVGPTVGFSIKDVALTNAILHIKEVGGSESIRQYWHHYFHGTEGLIYVVDASSSDEELGFARSELKRVLNHEHMKDVPLLALLNKTKKEDTDNLQKLSDKLDIPDLCVSRSFIIDAYSLQDIAQLKMLLEKLINIIKQGNNEMTSNPGMTGADLHDDGIKGRV